MYITSITWTVFHLVINILVSNTVTIRDSSVKSKISWLYNLDRTEYNSFPVFKMLAKSAEELMEFLCLYINAHSDMAKH